MEIKSNIYCRLEHFCIYEIEDRQPLRKEKSLLIKDNEELQKIEEYDVYVEEYEEFSSVKARILEIYKIWQERCEQMKKYQQKLAQQTNYSEDKSDISNLEVCVSVELFNRWEKHMTVAISKAGWMMPYYCDYALEYEQNLIKRGKIDRKKERIFLIYTPQYTEILECNFISQEGACNIIEEWLDTGKFTKHFFKTAIYFQSDDDIDIESIPF